MNYFKYYINYNFLYNFKYKEIYDLYNIKNYNLYYFTDKLKLINTLINKVFINYYASDIFTKNSKIMSLAALKIKITSFSVSKKDYFYLI